MTADLLGVVVISCKKCGKANSLDSKFCRSCGAGIVEDDVLRAREQNEQFITDGYRLLNEGREEEAELIARTAVDNDPGSASAMALLGDCHERAGKYDEALLCYEKVVDLNPDSALDKVRVTHLRKLLATQGLSQSSGSNTKNAFFAAVAAVVLVGAIGAIIALTTTKNTPSKLVASNSGATNTNVVQGFSEPAPGTTNPPSENSKQPNGEAPKPGASNGETPGGLKPNGPPAAGGRPVPSLGSGTSLPQPVPNGGTVDPNERGNVPIDPSKGFKVEPTGGGSSQPSSPPVNPDNPDPTPDRNSGQNEQPRTAPPEAVIDIKASGGQPKTNLGGGEMDAGAGAARSDTLIRVARNQFMTGNFSAAADAYEKALRAGAPSGSTNQRLAQCYEKLGRTSDAVSCYTKAARSFESSGNGSAAAACRQAIKVLQGG